MIIHTSEIAISRLPHVQLDSSFPLRDIVHMVLAGGPSQTLYNLTTGLHQRAVEFVCSHAQDAIREDDAGDPCITFDPPERPNESLGLLAVAGVRFDRVPVLTSTGNEGTLQDVVDSARKKFTLQDQPNSWSLMLFSVEPGIRTEWHNNQGELCSVELILRKELTHSYGAGACFGTHHLEGIAFALRKFCLENDVEPSQLRGIWLDAYQYVLGAIQLIRENQLEDGALQRAWFRKKLLPTSRLELSESLKHIVSLRNPDASLVYATGHLLDAVSPMADFFPDQDWMHSASYILAQTIDNHWTKIGREIGPLTHAIHALKLLDV